MCWLTRFLVAATALSMLGRAYAQVHYFSEEFLPHSFESPNKEFTLTIDYKKSTIQLFEKENQRWRTKWMQGAAPGQAYISNDGKHVVLLDTTPGSGDLLPLMDGNGFKLVVLDQNGIVVKSYRADDLWLGDDLDGRTDMGLTIHPSIDCPDGVAHYDQDNRRFFFLKSADVATDDFPSASRLVPVAIDVTTGLQVGLTDDEADMIKGPYIKSVRDILASKDSSAKASACRDAAALEDHESTELIKKLLADTTVSGQGSIGDSQYYAIHNVQNSAALALASLMGKDAAPLIMPLVAKSVGPTDREALLNALSLAGVPPDENVINQMERGSSYDHEALLRVLEHTDMKRAVKEARNLLNDSDERVRSSAQFLISQHGDETDVPYLKSLLEIKRDEETGISGLARINPPDLNKVLTAEARKGEWLAVMHLAERGDPAAQRRVVAWLDGFAEPNHAGRDQTGGVVDVYWASQILGKSNPPGGKAALRKALAIEDDFWDTDIHVRGALAQLGDTPYLTYLKEVAAGNEPSRRAPSDLLSPLRRSFAIQWLGDIKDNGSISLLQALTHDPHREIRDQAKKSLAKMGIDPEPTPKLAGIVTSTDLPTVTSVNAQKKQTGYRPSVGLYAAMVGSLIVAWLARNAIRRRSS